MHLIHILFTLQSALALPIRLKYKQGMALQPAAVPIGRTTVNRTRLTR